MKNLRDMDINAGLNALDELRDRLEELRKNPEIQNYAAEEYIEEAVESLEAAIADLKRAKDEE